MLDHGLLAQLREHFQQIVEPDELVARLDGSTKARSQASAA